MTEDDNSRTGNTENRFSQMLQCAGPFVSSDLQQNFCFLSQTLSFFDSIQALRKKGTSGAFLHSMSQQSVCDPEGLLRAIRPFCIASELRLVDLFLQLFQMKQVFELYRSMADVMPDSMADSMADFMSGEPGDSSSIFKTFEALRALWEQPQQEP